VSLYATQEAIPLPDTQREELDRRITARMDRDGADEDIAAAALWYETRIPGLGDAFLEAVQSAQRAIGLHPRCTPSFIFIFVAPSFASSPPRCSTASLTTKLWLSRVSTATAIPWLGRPAIEEPGADRDILDWHGPCRRLSFMILLDYR
jgi:hypothetical protein